MVGDHLIGGPHPSPTFPIYDTNHLGVGIDCYRTWEVLIMGAVPIVLESKLQPLYENMPVMVVKNWSDVTRESLNEFRSKLNMSADGVPWRPKIWLRYWIEEIYKIRSKFESFCKTDIFEE